MSETPLLSSTIPQSRLIIGAGLLLAVAALQTVRAEDTHPAPASDISVYEIMAEDAEALTFSAKDRQLWIYGKQRLKAFHRDGRTLLDRKFPQLPSVPHAVDMLVDNDMVWLAIANELYRINIKGQLVAERRFHDRIHALHFDPKKSQILVVTPRYVIVLNRQGRQIDKIRTRLPNIA